MGAPTVIQLNDPFAAGINAADSWAKGQNDAKSKALELARQKMLDERDEARAKQTQSNWQTTRDDTLAENATTDARANRVADSTISEQSAITANQKQVTKQAAILFPSAQKHAANLLIQDGDQHKAAQLKATGDAYDNTLKAIAAKHGEETARAAAALVQAQIQREQALTAQSYAEAYKARNTPAKLSGDDLKMAGLEARDALPPVLQNMLDQVESGQTNRVGLLTWARGNPQFAPYVPILAKLMTIPGTVGRASAAETRATGAADASARDDTGAMAPKALALKASKLMPQSGLPENIQRGILAELAKGVSTDAIRQQIDGAVVKGTTTPAYDAATQAKVDAFMRTLDPTNNPAAAATPQGGGFDLGQTLQHMIQGH
jgi:hypothetical protein